MRHKCIEAIEKEWDYPFHYIDNPVRIETTKEKSSGGHQSDVIAARPAIRLYSFNSLGGMDIKMAGVAQNYTGQFRSGSILVKFCPFCGERLIAEEN